MKTAESSSTPAVQPAIKWAMQLNTERPFGSVPLSYSEPRRPQVSSLPTTAAGIRLPLVFDTISNPVDVQVEVDKG